MSLKHGKNEISTMVAVLEEEHETVQDAALAALAAAEEVFAKRAKFMVVGQLAGSPEKPYIKPSDPEAIKVALDWYSTEGDARKAAEGLTSSATSGDTWRVWVLPLFHGSPAEMHAKQKQAYADAEVKAKLAAQERMKLNIEKRQREAEERARGGKGSCETEGCGHTGPDHLTDGSSRGRCGVTNCPCTKWCEKKK